METSNLPALPPLPVELIELIFGDISDVKTLASICSVSKLEQRVATPLLYHTLGVKTEEYFTGGKFDEAKSREARSLQLQCRTLLENRGLAKHVVEIRQCVNGSGIFHQHATELIEPRLCRKVLSEDIELAPELVDTLSRSFRGDSVCTAGACLTLLIALCPEVTILRLEGELGIIQDLPDLNNMLSDAYSRALFSFQALARRPASGLYTLQEIHLTRGFGYERCCVTAEGMVSLLHFPGLEKITTDSLDRSTSRTLGHEGFILESSVKTVVIQSCMHADLKTIFMALPHVENLSIEWARRETNFYRHDWREIGNYLTAYMPKLKHLTFDHHPDLDPWQMGPENMWPMVEDDYERSRAHRSLGSLKGMTELEKLTVSQVALCGSEKTNAYYGWTDMDEGEDDDEEVTLEALLPDSLKELTGK